MGNRVEIHPFMPYLPLGAKVLMLGTFPPKVERWSMDFFYPNWINDMWRIMGTVFYNDKNRFVDEKNKCFLLEDIQDFLTKIGVGIYDTGYKVRRLKDNASDKFLEIVEPVNLMAIIDLCPTIESIVTTGEKAAMVISEITASKLPKMGEKVVVEYGGKTICHYRMPSTSRAYPMNLNKKSEYYATMFRENNIRL